MATEVQQLELGAEVAEYFTRRPGVEFVGFAGLGRHGGALILDEKEDGRLLRKLVIKYSLGTLSSDERSNADDDLRNEYRCLQMLAGAEHIVQLVPFADCSLHLPGISDGEDTYYDALESMADIQLAQDREGETSARGATLTKQPLSVRKCPTFALEYLPYGTLLQFVRRLEPHAQLIPNRVMWRIWLCMVRQCVAMAFPPQQSQGNHRAGRERFIPNTEFFTLTQNSSHMANFVFASESMLFPDSDHDPHMPPVKYVNPGDVFPFPSQLLGYQLCSLVTKLIDFGRGHVEDPAEFEADGLPNAYECGARLNLWGAARVMGQVACPLADDDELENDHPRAYHYLEDGVERMVITDAPPAVRLSGEMDLALRDTIARCMAVDLVDIPPLEEVLAEAEEQVETRGPGDNPYLEDVMNVDETDRYIRLFLHRFIYNVPERRR
ncbi:hypothetical protein F4803DRAFT_556048 [Xylaria telfairii]|nr:hypothetical protein F4803DRAFT_556048 [Xylaria telfairii]